MNIVDYALRAQTLPSVDVVASSRCDATRPVRTMTKAISNAKPVGKPDMLLFLFLCLYTLRKSLRLHASRGKLIESRKGWRGHWGAPFSKCTQKRQSEPQQEGVDDFGIANPVNLQGSWHRISAPYRP